MIRVDAATAAALASADSNGFERGLGLLGAIRNLTLDEVQTALLPLVRALSIGPTERGRRIRVVLKEIGVSPADLISLHSRLPSDAVARNAIAGLLPAGMKPLLSRSPEEPATILISAVPAGMPSPTREAERTADVTQEFFRAVLLLGDESDHASNLALLRNDDRFAPFRVPNPEALHRASLEDVCGIVVGRSWWKNFSPDEHEAALKAVCEISSLLVVRIDIREFASSVDGRCEEICEKESLSGRLPNSFSWGEGCQLTGSDLTQIERQSSALRDSKTFRIEPAGLTASQAKVLRYAVVRHLGGRRHKGHQEVASVEVGAPAAGRSANKTLIVYPTGGEAPFVVRLGAFSFLKDEFRRIRELVTPFDPWVQPSLHFEEGAAALVYDVVADPDDSGKPAPTLASRFREWDADQLPDALKNGPDLKNLSLCVRRAFDRLKRMNLRPAPAASDWPVYEWIVDNIVEMEKHGLAFELETSEGKIFRVADLVRTAYNVIQPFEKIAFSHGDVNLDNVLARDDRDPFLIDYQMCGVGHPLYDICYFGTAILCGFFRPLVTEKEMAAALSVILESKATIDMVIDALPKAVAADCNRFCFEALIAMRDAAEELLKAHGLPSEHFRSMGIVVASYALTVRSVQSAPARALLAACALY